MRKRLILGIHKVDWSQSQLYDVVYFDGEYLNYTSAWSSGLGAAIGVVFRILDRIHIISKDYFHSAWGDNGATGGKTTGVHSVAKADLNGLYNTNKIIENLTHSSAHACRMYETEGTKAGDWYLPAEGENYLMYQGKSFLNSKLSSINGRQFGSEDYWSSTVVDNSNAWHVRMSAGNIYYDIRNWGRYYRPCLCLNFKGQIVKL